jgi:hypothetical protein
MNDLRALHMIHSTIKYYQIFGATPEIRDELLTVGAAQSVPIRERYPQQLAKS